MPDTAAIQAIENYVRKCGRDHSQWCTGIAADPVGQMLKVHGVAEEGDGCGWISFRCLTPGEAGEVRDHFVARGMNQAAGDGDASATSVYVFKITGTTRC
jgi:hypothetical protein